MPLESYFPFSSTFENDDTIYLQAVGIERTNHQNTQGLPGNLYIENGVLVSTMRDTETFTYSGHRADISWRSDTRGEYWYTWKIMIPTNWSSYNNRIIVAQIHDRPDSGDGSQYPNFLLMADNKEFSVITPTGIHPTVINSGEPRGGMPFTLGQWYDCCLHANWQISGGFFEFFINRIPLFRSYNVPTEYDNVQGPYLKIGLYDGYHWGDFGTKTAYFSEIKIWSGLESYETVMGGAPRAPSRLVQI